MGSRQGAGEARVGNALVAGRPLEGLLILLGCGPFRIVGIGVHGSDLLPD